MDTSQNPTEQKALVRDYFSRTAASYVESSSHRTGADLQRLLEIGEWNKDQRALDIATGGGHTALTIASRVAEVMVTDLTPRMLEHAKGFLLSQSVTNAQFQLADAEDLPFPTASFDRVTCRIAPHHFPNVAQAVAEVARVLKNEGLFLLIDSIAPSDSQLDKFDNTIEKWRDGSHIRSYTREEWHSFFEQAGLHVELEETYRRVLHYDEWTQRAQMSAEEKARLEDFILQSSEQIRDYFAVTTRSDGHIDHFSIDFLILKGRKA